MNRDNNAFNTFGAREIIRLEKKLTIERAFTTKPKTVIRRGCNIIRERCLDFTAILKEKHGCTHEIPLENAKRIFQLEKGIWDRASLKAYFGTQPGVSKREIERTATYARTGTVSTKIIQLRQKIPKCEGYLERLGLVSYEKRGSTWFMVLTPEISIVPEIVKSSPLFESPLESVNECSESKVIIDNFSLTPIALGEQHGHELNVETVENGEKRERVIGCERNRLSESILELKILEAKPCENRDRSFVYWPRVARGPPRLSQKALGEDAEAEKSSGESES